MEVNGLEYSQENIDSINESSISRIIDDVKILLQTKKLKRTQALSIIAELNIDEEVFEEVAILANTVNNRSIKLNKEG